jgi:mannosyl-3-phosphoglycerate phosphatase
MNKYIVFTDLDGTLLDSETYEFTAAVEAILFLKKNRIPIIPCTSKTHKEVIRLRRKLKIYDPFIVENGSAIFYPVDYFRAASWPSAEIDDYRVRILGKSYSEIINFLHKLKSKYNLDITGFHEMDALRIAEITSLDAADAETAKYRYFSEPFIFNNRYDFPEEAVNDIKSEGFRLLRGNRFFHLLGNCDKGDAVREVTKMFQTLAGNNNLKTIGIGDSMNDLEMLQNVQFPVLVKKHNGRHQDGINLNNILLTRSVGPAGWSEAVLKLVDF